MNRFNGGKFNTGKFQPRPQGLLGGQNGGSGRHFECREDPGDEVGEIQDTFSKRQKIKQFVEREALNVGYL